MELKNGLHLAYCTNVHPGKDWNETFHSLERWTLSVKEKVCPSARYGIGLRLSDLAARELSEPAVRLAFQKWLDRHDCYVFTINGFPFGNFHSSPVKEEVYRPDWQDPRRVDYTVRLFELLAAIMPPDVEGSVSTLPGSFKEFITHPEQTKQIRANLAQCVDQIARISERTGRALHLGLEPEPLGLFENTAETVSFFEALWTEHPRLHSDRRRFLGVNYDTCHFAVEFEEAQAALARFKEKGIRISKIHISNALKLAPSTEARAQLAQFAEDTYLHQVVARAPTGEIRRFKDLDLALKEAAANGFRAGSEEWRVHFHVPLHAAPFGALRTTEDHPLAVFQFLKDDPALCQHLEMETYTWAVLPPALKTGDVADQLVQEYAWTLKQLAAVGLA